jgi:ATP-dependent protease ClpP protease subunit
MAKKLTHDDVDKFFEYGIDIPNRTIYLGEAAYDEYGNGNGVDFFMAERFIKALHILDNTPVPQGKDNSIIVITNNPGGSWYDGMAMYGAIKACKNPVTFKMYGYAMSMGSIIPQAADERIIDKYCRFMIHYGYDGSSGHSKIFEKHGDEGKKVNYAMENIYLDQMLEKDEEQGKQGEANYLERVLADVVNKQQSLDYPPPEKLIKYKFSKDPEQRREDVRKVLKELLNFDTFLTAEETVALGLADKVADEDD